MYSLFLYRYYLDKTFVCRIVYIRKKQKNWVKMMIVRAGWSIRVTFLSLARYIGW